MAGPASASHAACPSGGERAGHAEHLSFDNGVQWDAQEGGSYIGDIAAADISSLLAGEQQRAGGGRICGCEQQTGRAAVMQRGGATQHHVPVRIRAGGPHHAGGDCGGQGESWCSGQAGAHRKEGARRVAEGGLQGALHHHCVRRQRQRRTRSGTSSRSTLATGAAWRRACRRGNGRG